VEDAEVNPLYKPDGWELLLLQEQLEAIRTHLCTGPGGQSSEVMRQRSRIDVALRAAIRYLNKSDLADCWRDQ
jgi:hypothetical protein